MPELNALFQGILAHRYEDAPRLEYANALGDVPRGEFIKVQLAMAGRQALVGWEHYSARRELELLRVHGSTWGAEIAPMVDDFAFRRGFVESVVLPGDRFLSHADALFRRAPILDVTLRSVPEALFRCERLIGLRSLNLANTGVADADVSRLVASPFLRELRWLDLTGNQIGESGMEALVATDNLPSLRWVGLASNRAEDPTPQPIEEAGFVHGSAWSRLGRALVDKYGERTWLKEPGLQHPRPWEL